MRSRLSILQVSTSDGVGGAEKVAYNLFREYRSRGYRSQMAVGYKRGDDPDVFVVPNEAAFTAWERVWRAATRRLSRGEVRGTRRIARAVRFIGEPGKALHQRRGIEDFRFPGTRRIIEAAGAPDLIHCHNLHGEYFDLRALEWLSRRLPVVITMHDAWLLSGHCVHSFECERWRTGCGHCPDLTLYPAVERDATAANWKRKRRIYSASRLYVATPSRWLMDKVQQSMLVGGIAATRVIPYGIDLGVFTPQPRAASRAALGLPDDACVIVFAANAIRKNIWKDYETVRAAVACVAERATGRRVIFVGLGDDGPNEPMGRAEVRFVPYENDPSAVARFYSAADIYVHGARADTFPNVVLEALACGTPVVGTAVGGIPEQIKGAGALGRVHSLNAHPDETATGVLVPVRDPAAMARSIEALLLNPDLCRRLGANAAKDAVQRFDLGRQVDEYLGWYSEILEHHRSARQQSALPA